MTGINKNNKCRRIRGFLSVPKGFGLDANWLQNHITNCPRCQRRLVSYGKVNLAISAIKSQPHKLDLLMCANAQAIGVLKHSLRQAQKAKKLRTIRPEPKLRERFGKYASSAANIAACIAIMLLMKFGIFSSMDTFQTQGQKVIKQYYASRIGDDLADEIFPKDTNLSVHSKNSVSLRKTLS
ncbi:hypothetical protein ES703_83941 [subsurface metagenome]